MTKEQLLSKLVVEKESEVITNPYSGEFCKLEPLAVALYDYIKGCEILKDTDSMMLAINIFVEKWPDEYYILLD